MYVAQNAPAAVDNISLQELALLFMALAMGVLHNLELVPNDPLADEYTETARRCLVMDSFMTKTTMAGAQTVVGRSFSTSHKADSHRLLWRITTCGRFCLQKDDVLRIPRESEPGRNGDSAWPLWGLAMRMAQGVGLFTNSQALRRRWVYTETARNGGCRPTRWKREGL